MLYNNI